MRKQKLLLAALMCAIVFTGCKKKPVDLSSLHTTAAVERETMPVTTEAETTAPPKESTVSDDKSPGSQYSIKTAMKSYIDKKSSVEYPEISGMKDVEKQKQVNEILRRNAQAITAVYPSEGDGQSLTVKATVESANLKRITVTYGGESADKTTRIFFTNTVDLETGKNLGLSDLTDPYTVAGYIASGDYKLEAAFSDEQGIRAYINTADKTTDYYYKLLSASDFSGEEGEAVAYTTQNWPQVFSYEKQGIIYIRLPLPQELGSFAIIRYNPDNK